MDEIDKAYEQAHFSMEPVGAGDKYELPVSKGPTYDLATRPDPAAVKAALERQSYALIAPVSELNYLSVKVLDTETNEFAYIKLSGNKLRIFPKDENFSAETLERIVDTLRSKVCDMELQEASEILAGADDNE